MAKSQNKWLERYTDGGLYIPLEGTSYVVRQQISKPRTYAKGGLGDGDGDNDPKNKNIKVYTDPDKFKVANQAYQDSLGLYNLTNKLLRGNFGAPENYKSPATPKYWDDYKVTYKEAVERAKAGDLIGVLIGDVDYEKVVSDSFKKKIKPAGYTYGDFSIPVYYKPKVKPVLEEKKLTDQSFNFPGELTYTKKELTPFEDEVVSFSDYTDSINKIKDLKTKTKFKKSENNNIKNTIKQVKRKLFPGYRLPYQYQSARVPLFENGGWLNQYEEGGYADDSAVLNTEGQEVNTMQFAAPTLPTFNFGDGDGDDDPKNGKKKKKKPVQNVDTKAVQQKRHDALNKAKEKLLLAETPENRAKMEMLYSTTMAAENEYGFNPKAYNRKSTNSMMSIDEIALTDLFKPKGEKNRYTQQQKNNFQMLTDLGLPTDKAGLKKLLRNEDPYAALGTVKTLYRNEGVLSNLPNPTDTAAYINLYIKEFNKEGAIKHQDKDKLQKSVLQKMRDEKKRNTPVKKPNTIKVKNLKP